MFFWKLYRTIPPSNSLSSSWLKLWGVGIFLYISNNVYNKYYLSIFNPCFKLSFKARCLNLALMLDIISFTAFFFSIWRPYCFIYLVPLDYINMHFGLLPVKCYNYFCFYGRQWLHLSIFYLRCLTIKYIRYCLSNWNKKFKNKRKGIKSQKNRTKEEMVSEGSSTIRRKHFWERREDGKICRVKKIILSYS